MCDDFGAGACSELRNHKYEDKLARSSSVLNSGELRAAWPHIQSLQNLVNKKFCV